LENSSKEDFDYAPGDYEPVIIQLREFPLLSYKKLLDDEIKDQERRIRNLEKKRTESGGGEDVKLEIETAELKEKLRNLKKEYPFKIEQYKNKALSGHENVKDELIKNHIKIKIKKEFFYTFNGMAANVPEDYLDNIKNLTFIRAIYTDTKVHVTLSDSVPLISADEVWRLKDSAGKNVTGLNITIAIIDTGIDYTHKDLGNCSKSEFTSRTCEKVVGGYDFYNFDNDPIDDHGHGTHVAGIAAGDGEIEGVAPDANLLAYKVLGSDGIGVSSSVISGIEQAVKDGADIISLSLGTTGNSDDPMSQAVDTAVDSGVIVVVAAGNEGPNYETISSPGTARNAITVGAIDKSERIASFSSRGPIYLSGEEILIKPDIVSPGVSINSSAPMGNCSLCNPTGYRRLSGTSMATPHVTGAAALLLQMNPDWTPEDVKSAIILTSVNLEMNPYIQGAGRLDVLEAINTSILVSPSNLGLREIRDGTNLSYTISIKNLKPFPITLNLSAADVRDLYGESYSIASINASTLTLNPGESRSILLTLNFPISLEGDFYGRVLISEKGKNYSFPFAGRRFSDVEVEAPFIGIWTGRAEYTFGETMTVGLNVSNPGEDRFVDIYIWVDLPGVGKYWVLRKPSVNLVSGLDFSRPQWKSMPLLISTPTGEYAWHALIYDPANSEIISESIAPWTFKE
jgi:subtilisin family serine protease